MVVVKMLMEYDFEGSVFVNKMFVWVFNGFVKFIGFF